MKSYIKSIIFLSCIFVGCNYVCGMEYNKKPEPVIVEGRTVIATFNIDNYHANEYVRIINDRGCDTTNTRTDIDRIDIYKLGEGDKIMLDGMQSIDAAVQCGRINKKHNFSSTGKYRLYYYFKQDVTITDMSCIFYECSSLFDVDFSHFNTENVTDMSFMFSLR